MKTLQLYKMLSIDLKLVMYHVKQQTQIEEMYSGGQKGAEETVKRTLSFRMFEFVSIDVFCRKQKGPIFPIVFLLVRAKLFVPPDNS